MRWLMRIVGALVLLVLLGVAALFLIPTETVARLAAAEFRKATGRTLTFEGDVSPTVWPQLGVRTGPVTLANADWSEAGPMLTAQSLSVAVDMAALIGGTVRVTGIELVEPRLLLERAGDGRVNWAFAPEATPAAPADGGTAPSTARTPFTIDEALVRGGTVLYADRGRGTETRIEAIDLALRVPDFQGQAEVDLSARFRDRPVTVTGQVSGFADALEGRVVPVALTATAGDSRIGFDGRLGLSPFAGEGAVEADLSDLGALFAVLGQSAPDLPEGLGRRSIAASGALTLTAEGSVHLRDGVVTLDDNRLTGAFDLVPGETRPKLTAQLSAGALAFAAAESPSGGGAGGGAGGASGGWSTAPIDASGLGVLDAEISLAAESLRVGPLNLGPARLGVTIDRARAVMDLREVQGYGGTLSGQVIANARDGFSSRVTLSMAGLALQPFLSDLAGYQRVSGTGDLRINLLGAGGSMDALMRSLSGDGSLAFRDGAVAGFDLERLVASFGQDAAEDDGASTVFDALTGTFAVEGGVLRNGDLALTAPLVTASGSGTVDIGAQSLDYRVVPLSLRGNPLDIDAQIPIRISGPWASPSIRPDLESVARRRLEEEAQRFEERARTEIEDKLREELGGIEGLEGLGGLFGGGTTDAPPPPAPAAPDPLAEPAPAAPPLTAEEALQNEAERALNQLLGLE